MKLVIVESPSKAKTINKYLGKDYIVIASYGHMRDLPSKSGSVLPEKDFEMTWEVNDRGKKNFADIMRAVKTASHICLATDPDREGEAISWHILQMLNEKNAIKDQEVQRVTYTEITKKAIEEAFKNPRILNQELVDAYLARRALDYLVGFTLSPLLWRKLPGSKSAGRVQSVALRLITDRESEIEKFITQEYWTIEVELTSKEGKPFTARLTHLNGKKLEKFDIPNEQEATSAVNAILGSPYTVGKVEPKQVKRHPYAPFITSTMQQEASRKLGMSATKTMRTAQSLYEGVSVAGENVGLITYMRTDGVQLSPDAINSIREQIVKDFGADYVPKSPRMYKSKAKNAQEAHEAIRPTDMSRTPDSLRGQLTAEENKLYELIWKRAMASQMESAIMDQVAVDIPSADGKTTLRANGSIVKFDGFLKLYQEDKDDKDDEDDSNRRLPKLTEGDALGTEKATPKQHFTEPPPRYTEASLVKKMEELGIGRPSTYANILQVLQDRSYVRLDKKRFYPEERGRIVTSFLYNFFTRYVEYDFTAHLEDELDEISDGKLEWKKALRAFWKDFSGNIDATADITIPDILTKIEEELGHHYFPTGNRRCPTCEAGQLGLKLGKFGAFIGCSNYPNCTHTQQLIGNDTQLHEEESHGNIDLSTPKILGKDPETGKDVSLRKGPYGVYLQIGEAEDGVKPKRATIPPKTDLSTFTLDAALSLLSLPRLVGVHPETKLEIVANIGRFGPYLKYGPMFITVPPADDVMTIGLNRAVVFIAERRPDIRFLGFESEKAVLCYRSKYGYIVAYNGKDAPVPKGTNPADVTKDEAISWITERAATAKPKKTATKKSAAKKAPAKKKAAAKKN